VCPAVVIYGNYDVEYDVDGVSVEFQADEMYSVEKKNLCPDLNRLG